MQLHALHSANKGFSAHFGKYARFKSSRLKRTRHRHGCVPVAQQLDIYDDVDSFANQPGRTQQPCAICMRPLCARLCESGGAEKLSRLWNGWSDGTMMRLKAFDAANLWYLQWTMSMTRLLTDGGIPLDAMHRYAPIFNLSTREMVKIDPL